MEEKLIRVGTTYLPVRDVEESVDWYVRNLGAALSYQDKQKAIINLADQSFFLVKSQQGQTANFHDENGDIQASLTFEVDGVEALTELHSELIEKGIKTGEIEDRGHPGRNFIFNDVNGNMFDVWSELSQHFRKK
ncbi:VOC family protein [Halobacillus sp. Marseille-Q1614]|uniref:VOC family protein n=1 Tax=Halobacillus sp. Marseille-Q1614 TaxID=2709134 RepID=UPI00156FA3DD|nr:VOC family protein [Halobacillus sp. Marseille-Q1614]